jgi:hypothetical protein
MANTASLFPELCDRPENTAGAQSEGGQCTPHTWIKPTEDDSPEVIAKCQCCGITMVPRRPQTEV